MRYGSKGGTPCAMSRGAGGWVQSEMAHGCWLSQRQLHGSHHASKVAVGHLQVLVAAQARLHVVLQASKPVGHSRVGAGSPRCVNNARHGHMARSRPAPNPRHASRGRVCTGHAAARTRIMLRICSATMPTLPSPMAAVSHCGEEGRGWDGKA